MKDAESHGFSFELDIDSFDIILQNGTMHIELKKGKEHYGKKFNFDQMHFFNRQIFTNGVPKELESMTKVLIQTQDIDVALLHHATLPSVLRNQVRMWVYSKVGEAKDSKDQWDRMYTMELDDYFRKKGFKYYPQENWMSKIDVRFYTEDMKKYGNIPMEFLRCSANIVKHALHQAQYKSVIDPKQMTTSEQKLAFEIDVMLTTIWPEFMDELFDLILSAQKGPTKISLPEFIKQNPPHRYLNDIFPHVHKIFLSETHQNPPLHNLMDILPLVYKLFYRKLFEKIKDAESCGFSFDLDIDAFDIICHNETFDIELKKGKEHCGKKFDFEQMHIMNRQIFTNGVPKELVSVTKVLTRTKDIGIALLHHATLPSVLRNLVRMWVYSKLGEAKDSNDKSNRMYTRDLDKYFKDNGICYYRNQKWMSKIDVRFYPKNMSDYDNVPMYFLACSANILKHTLHQVQYQSGFDPKQITTSEQKLATEIDVMLTTIWPEFLDEQFELIILAQKGTAPSWHPKGVPWVPFDHIIGQIENSMRMLGWEDEILGQNYT
ncbi:hypothetical protein PS1_008155 [Malus domestica]